MWSGTGSTTEIDAPHETAVTISQSHQCGSLVPKPLPSQAEEGAVDEASAADEACCWLQLTLDSANSFSHCY